MFTTVFMICANISIWSHLFRLKSLVQVLPHFDWHSTTKSPPDTTAITTERQWLIAITPLTHGPHWCNGEQAIVWIMNALIVIT